MYAVVGCTDCAALWLVSDPEASKTTRCPRCGRRHQIKKLRRFFESPSEDEARQARSELLAKKQGASEAFADLDSVAELERRTDEPAVDDREYLEASGIDADAVAAAGSASRRSRGRDQVVEDAIREQDRPTEAEIVDYAAEHGVPADAARDLLQKLTRRGDASESGGRYRLL
jgi:DNA-directed RNA polymerase subunit RPC12/RpoP/DNA replicative helicase MCM subunit Mcm2 (Cdc46/Mcm family)